MVHVAHAGNYKSWAIMIVDSGVIVLSVYALIHFMVTDRIWVTFSTG